MNKKILSDLTWEEMKALYKNNNCYNYTTDGKYIFEVAIRQYA